jgi:hypothetical protein
MKWSTYYALIFVAHMVTCSLVTYYLGDIMISGETEAGLIPRFVITILTALVPAFVGMQQSVEAKRTSVAWLYMQTATLLMNFVSSVAWYRNPRELGTLPDIGHDILGEHTGLITFNLPVLETQISFEASKISDNLILSLLVFTAIFVGSQKNWLDITKRFMIVYATLEVMRSFTLLLTSLPDASAECRELTPIGDLPSGGSSWSSIANNDAWLLEIIVHALKILIPVHPVTCGDMVFSGHSNTACCLAHVWHTYYKWVPQQINWVKTTVWLIALGAIVGLLLTHVHYTLDVVLSIYFSITLWAAYHRLAIDVFLGHRFIAVWYIDTKLIYPFVEFMEKPLPGTHLNGEMSIVLTKEKGEMNLFELQCLGVAIDDIERVNLVATSPKRLEKAAKNSTTNGNGVTRRKLNGSANGDDDDDESNTNGEAGAIETPKRMATRSAKKKSRSPKNKKDKNQ